jgi:hypothetical protein
MAVSVRDRERVRAHAKGRCEYCRMANDWEPFFPYHVEHIVPRQHRGSDELPNLALSCHHCNLVKGPNLTSIDPDTGIVTELFHPTLPRRGSPALYLRRARERRALDWSRLRTSPTWM